MRRKLAGPFVVHDVGDGAWRLSRSSEPPLDVFLSGAEADAGSLLQHAGEIDIEWREETAVVTVTSVRGKGSVTTAGAIIHEPLAHLYECLPLVSFDSSAQRFWRRVFLVVRIPGGRYLLRLLARRARRRG